MAKQKKELSYPEMVNEIVKAKTTPRWTKKAVAEACGVTATTIHNICRPGGENSMFERTARAIRELHAKVCG